MTGLAVNRCALVRAKIALNLITNNVHCFIYAEINCGSLDNPSNGKVLADADLINSVATYSCNPGYALVGDVTRTCQNSGIWSDKAPTCIGKYGIIDACLNDRGTY